MISPLLAYAFAAAFATILLYSAVSDVRSFTIPNWASLGLVALYFAWVGASGAASNVWAHLTVAAIAFAVTFGFFALGWFGAADAKLITALMLWAGPEHGTSFVFILALCGAVFAALLLLLSKVLGRYPRLGEVVPLGRLAGWARHGVCPYGVPIVIAGFAVIPRLFQLG